MLCLLACFHSTMNVNDFKVRFGSARPETKMLRKKILNIRSLKSQRITFSFVILSHTSQISFWGSFLKSTESALRKAFGFFRQRLKRLNHLMRGDFVQLETSTCYNDKSFSLVKIISSKIRSKRKFSLGLRMLL